MIGGQGKDCCGIGETPQSRDKSSPAARRKRSLAQKTTACNKRSILAPVSNLFVFRVE
ncbi:hypothetical protein [Priestia aryabhattai]|uniref:hypothetical protein n=1 Tax=Priestia aryabhattai TaxID=412384 RepID=UPI002E1EFA53|nr:hypothetical protein [Priestia aryabhattai]